MENKIVGVWPYFKKSKYGITYLTLPPLVPYLGPILIYNTNFEKQIHELSFEKKVLSMLSDNLPNADLIICQGYPEWKNWQPLSWKGFSQTTRYTYRLDLLKSLEVLWGSLESKKRNSITMAQREIEIRREKDSAAIFDLWNTSLNRKETRTPITSTFFNNLDMVTTAQNSRFSFSAFRKNQRIASAYVLYDKSVAYLIMTGRNLDGPKGTMSALIWKCIEESKNRKLEIFDFEGSMIEGVESFFRSFGGVQTAYHRLSKTKNKIFKVLFQTMNKI